MNMVINGRNIENGLKIQNETMRRSVEMYAMVIDSIRR
jgi:hypothetical protein